MTKRMTTYLHAVGIFVVVFLMFYSVRRAMEGSAFIAAMTSFAYVTLREE